MQTKKFDVDDDDEKTLQLSGGAKHFEEISSINLVVQLQRY